MRYICLPTKCDTTHVHNTLKVLMYKLFRFALIEFIPGIRVLIFTVLMKNKLVLQV